VCWDDEIVVTSKRTGEPLHVAHHLVPDAREIRTTRIEPGEVVTLEMWFTAPTNSGTVMSYWVGTLDDGTPFFDENSGLWAMVNVSTLADTIAFTPYNSSDTQ
jgi:hypothetical protein